MLSKIERQIERVKEARDNYVEACEALKIARQDFEDNPLSDPISYALASAQFDQEVAGLVYRTTVVSGQEAHKNMHKFADALQALKAARRNYVSARCALKLARAMAGEDPRNERIAAAAGDDFEESVCLYTAATVALQSERKGEHNETY